MFLLWINSPALEFVSFHDFQTWPTVSAFRGQSIHPEFREFWSCHFLHLPGNSWVRVREVAALGVPGVCPCAVAPAGDSCVAPALGWLVALLQLQAHRSHVWDEQIRVLFPL